MRRKINNGKKANLVGLARFFEQKDKKNLESLGDAHAIQKTDKKTKIRRRQFN